MAKPHGNGGKPYFNHYNGCNLRWYSFADYEVKVYNKDGILIRIETYTSYHELISSKEV